MLTTVLAIFALLLAILVIADVTFGGVPLLAISVVLLCLALLLPNVKIGQS